MYASRIHGNGNKKEKKKVERLCVYVQSRTFVPISEIKVKVDSLAVSNNRIGGRRG